MPRRSDQLDSFIRVGWLLAGVLIGGGFAVVAPLAMLLRTPALVTAASLLAVGVSALAVAYHLHRRLVQRLVESEAHSRGIAREQAALRRVASSVAAEASADQTFAQIARESAELLDADAGLVVRFRRMEAVTEGWWSGRQPEMAERFPLEGQGALAHVSRGAGAARVDAFEALPEEDAVAQIARQAGYVSSVAAPISAEGALWGAVLVARTDGAFEPSAEERLRHFAELAGLAVANADARAALAAQAATDPLTRLANHRVFHERLWAEAERALRHGRTLALVVLDLDNFKQINDVHGHQTGDDVLRAVGEILAAQARSSETVARIGGEEFAWILPESTSLGAWQAAERVRAAIARAFAGTAHPVSVSAGVCDVAEVTRRGGAAELFEHADTALYWAKTHGRDVCFRYTREVASALATGDPAGANAEVDGGMVSSSAAVRALAQALDSVDPPTLLHCARVALVTSQMAISLGWTPRRAALVRDAATLHDIGKIGIPALGDGDGPRSDHEGARARAHVETSARIVASVMSAEQTAWVRHHHEHWNGSGYPSGLAGDDIPVGARILAVADAWDSLTAPMPWGRGLDPLQAIGTLERAAGTMYWEPAVAGLADLLRSGTVLGVTSVADTGESAPGG